MNNSSKITKGQSVAIVVLFILLEWGLWFLRVPFFRIFGVTSNSSDQLIYYFGLGFDIVVRVLLPLFVLSLIYKQSPKRWGVTLKGAGFEKWIVLVVCAALFAFMSLTGTINVLSDGKVWPLIWWSAIYFISSIDQEIRYRGILQTELAQFMPYKINLIISSLLFTFSPLHLGNNGTIIFFISTFILGIYAGYLRQRSGSLVGPVFVHFFGGFAFNVLAILAA